MNPDPSKVPHADKPLSRVISVCEKKDINAWRIASGRIVRHIEADHYELICPESQVLDFQAVSDPRWRVVGEGKYSDGCDIEHIRSRVSGHNRGRSNWIFQQFLKINAIVDPGSDDDDLVLIWDSDTVPLRAIRFLRKESGALICYHGSEVHQPYFKTIGGLFGFGKATDESFIAQCLPVRVGWVRSMIAEIEGKFGMPYSDAVLRLLPGESGSEFSEYETIGTWVMHRHPGALEFRKRNRWMREGIRYLGRNPSVLRTNVVLWILSQCYDFVALETWTRPVTFKRVKDAVLRRIS